MARTSVRLHNMGSYTKVSVMEYMYTCEHMYVCKEVLSASTRRGTDICEFAQHGFTYKSICDMIYVYFWVYACIQRGSNCEHSQGHKQVWECTARVDIPTYPWYDSWYMYTCEYMYVYNDVIGVSTRKGTNICQLSQHGFIYKSICDGIYVYLWAHVCMQRGSKCEHSQGHRHMWVRTTWVHI